MATAKQSSVKPSVKSGRQEGGDRQRRVCMPTPVDLRGTFAISDSDSASLKRGSGSQRPAAFAAVRQAAPRGACPPASASNAAV
eukprot:COSAG05_NODE_500_length_9234_cov_107.281664_2_plen_84_part_00